MKKLLFLFLLPIFMGLTFGNMPVFDLTNWLSAIDMVYTQFDMINNTITQIENQYQQIQMAVESAKSIDWSNIKFDGDWDIRNEIKDATSKVNRVLSSARKIKNTITTPSITCGTGKYSIADLCTLDGMEQAITDTADFMTENMKAVIKNFEEGMDEEQKQAIWAKYGISPQNYLFVQQSVKQIKDGATRIIAAATEKAVEMKLEETSLKTNAIITAAMENVDSNGQPTSAGMMEGLLLLTDETITQLQQLGISINDLANIIANKMIAEENEKEVKAAEQKEQREIQERKDSKTSSRFKKS